MWHCQFCEEFRDFETEMRTFSTIIGLSLALAQPAMAADAPLAATPQANPLGPTFVNADFVSGAAIFTLGSLSPTFGAVSIGISPTTSAMIASATSNGRGGQDISAGYATDLYGSQVGIFGGYAGRPAQFAPEPSTAWNLGASVGYAGFYVRGAFTDVVERGLVDTWQSRQLGFGYGTGNLDLRLTYVESDAGHSVMQSIGGLDASQWMIGGMYKVSSRIRLNADAFTGNRETATIYGRLSATPGATAPQGTGARVGVQLRF